MRLKRVFVKGDSKNPVGVTENHQRPVYYSKAGRMLRGSGLRLGQAHDPETDLDSVCPLLRDTAMEVDAHQDNLEWILPYVAGCLASTTTATPAVLFGQ